MVTPINHLGLCNWGDFVCVCVVIFCHISLIMPVVVLKSPLKYSHKGLNVHSKQVKGKSFAISPPLLCVCIYI